MMKKFTIAAAVMAFAAVGVSARPASAQGQDKPKETTVVIKDDATPKAKKAASATKHAANKTGEVVSDASITTAVKTRLMKDPAARATSIDVDTKDGVVTIAGAVPSAADRQRIDRLVARTTGVKHVDNKLTVGKTAPTSGHVEKKDSGDTTIVIKNDTKESAEKVKDAAAKAGKATANAVGGAVDAVKNTDVKIKDDTKVKIEKNDGDPTVRSAGEATGDAAITTAVKSRLMSDEVARGTSIDVETRSGVVTISGTVPTAADKVRIGQLVEKTSGVKTVSNKLTVK